MDTIIDVSYQFQKDNDILQTNETITTKIQISPNQTIGFYALHFKLDCHIKGRLNVGSIAVASTKLEGQNTWEKDSNQEYEIQLIVPNAPISFSGENLEFVWYLILELQLDDHTKSLIRGKLLKETRLLKLAKTYNGKIISKQLIEVSNKNSGYEISDFEEIHLAKAYIHLFIGIFIIIGTLLIYYDSNTINFLSIIAIIIGIALIGYAIYKQISVGLLGEISIRGAYIDIKSFRIIISPEKNLKKIKNIHLYYTINEEVEDDRGSSSTVYSEIIFESQDYTLTPPFKKHITKELTYPLEEQPTYFKHKNARIFWQLHIKVLFKNGLSYTIKQEFKVF